jgi:hypothetical protein
MHLSKPKKSNAFAWKGKFKKVAQRLSNKFLAMM